MNGLDKSIHRGIGLLASEFGVPVIPIRITGLERRIRLLPIPHRDSVTIQFGEPIMSTLGASYKDMEAALQTEMSPVSLKAVAR